MPTFEPRRSRRTNPYKTGFVPPRADKLRRAIHPEHDPAISAMVESGELTSDDVAAMGEVRSREFMYNARKKSHHQRSQDIEKTIIEKRKLLRADQTTPKGRRRKDYTGVVATHASKFEDQQAKKSSPGEVTIKAGRVVTEKTIVLPSYSETDALLADLAKGSLAPTEVSIQILDPEPVEPVPAKDGPLASMRKEWDDSEFEEIEDPPAEDHTQDATEEPVEAIEATQEEEPTSEAKSTIKKAKKGSKKKTAKR